MPKRLRVHSGKDVCGILSKHGFVKIRQKGSHVVMQKSIYQSTITVVVPDHNELQVGTLQSVIRQSGIPRSEFE